MGKIRKSHVFPPLFVFLLKYSLMQGRLHKCFKTKLWIGRVVTMEIRCKLLYVLVADIYFSISLNNWNRIVLDKKNCVIDSWIFRFFFILEQDGFEVQLLYLLFIRTCFHTARFCTYVFLVSCYVFGCTEYMCFENQIRFVWSVFSSTALTSNNKTLRTCLNELHYNFSVVFVQNL